MVTDAWPGVRSPFVRSAVTFTQAGIFDLICRVRAGVKISYAFNLMNNTTDQRVQLGTLR